MANLLPNYIIAFIATFFLTIILGPILIPILKRLNFGQTVREDGPSSHLVKMGTPTMGGVMFLIPVSVMSIYYAKYDPKILSLLFVTLGFGVVGFVDDYIKVIRKRKDGLYAMQKMVGLVVVSVIFAFYVSITDIGTDIIIPFIGNGFSFDLYWMFIPFIVIVLLSATNAVNITDGVDGLASGVTLIAILFFALIASLTPADQYIRVFALCIAGGCLGFLGFNWYPAKVFMGDVGSLALGGAVSSVAIVLKMPLILLIVGFVYVIETLSVVIQVGHFKLRGTRVFKMAPIHHHFELSGWKETSVVFLFYAITIIMGAIAFASLKLRIF